MIARITLGITGRAARRSGPVVRAAAMGPGTGRVAAAAMGPEGAGPSIAWPGIVRPGIVRSGIMRPGMVATAFLPG